MIPRLASLLAVATLVAGCASPAPKPSSATGPAVGPNAIAALVGGPGGQVRVGDRCFTRTTLHIVRGNQVDYESWLSGEVLPMGTSVSIVETAKDDTRWRFRTDDGRDFWIVIGYGAGYKDQYQEIQKFLAPQDPNAAFDAGAFADDVRFGRPAVGMTRAQVLAACGFPPAITDPDHADQWRYPQLGSGWRAHGWARIANQHKVSVEFSGDKVVRVLGYEVE